jgi:hypothetical protein
MSRASQRLIDAVEGSAEYRRLLTRTMVGSDKVIDDFLTSADAVILTRVELRLLLERFTQQLLTRQSQLMDDDEE